MSIQLSIENFEEIYNNTYNRTLMYIVCKCLNIDDVNDLLQETYIELYKILKRKEYIVLENYQNYIIGIAKKKIKRKYGLIYKQKNYSIDDEKYELEIPSDLNTEMDVVTKLNAQEVWKYIKQKNITVIKIFYLYYYSELKISQIAEQLYMSESNVKNVLYRTIKNIKKDVKLEGDIEDV